LVLYIIDPFHELGNETAQFMKWAISQIGHNIYTFCSTDRLGAWM